MPYKELSIWDQETRLLSMTTQNKQNTYYIFLSIISFACFIIVISTYLVIPLTLMLAPLHDWLAQLLGAICILIFMEGLIGMTLLKIAQAVPVKKNVSSSVASLPLDYEKTVYLPLVPTQLLPRLELSQEFLSASQVPTQLLSEDKTLVAVRKPYLASLYAKKWHPIVPNLELLTFPIETENNIDQNNNR